MSDNDFETIRIERPVDHLGAIVLDRPDAMNSINAQMLDEPDFEGQ